MWASELQVVGLSGFSDSGVVELKPGLNLVVGQNNAGKSALLAALGHRIPNLPHRDEQRFKAHELPLPFARMLIHFTHAELREAAMTRNGPVQFPTSGGTVADQQQMRMLFDTPDQHLLVEREYGLHPVIREGIPPTYNQTGTLISQNGAVTFSPNPSADASPFGALVSHLWDLYSFHFRSQRYSLGTSSSGRATRLTWTADNLPQVLATLQGERGDDFKSLIDQVSEIFDNVGNLSVGPTPDNRLEIRTWPTPRMADPQLGFNLDDSGTGVAQVIAIITAAMTNPPGVIVIDEINSFLHPAAAKALLRNLQTRYPEHQYVVSTHSPEIIASGMSSNVLLVRRSGYESQVKSIDLSDVGSLREVCGVLGVAMSDVFAADGIIWVEGQTEEALVPYIYSALVGAPPKGVLVTAVVATGDFNARRARDRALALEVYSKLSKAASPLIERAVFSFDREGLSDGDQRALAEQSAGAIHFLPRRNIESYFLHPAAIADLINLRPGETVLTSEQVEDWLLQHGGDDAYKAADVWTGMDIRNPAWLAKVDGAKLIQELVVEVTGATYEYRKTSDGIEIVRFLISHDQCHLSELVAYIRQLYDAATPALELI